MSGSRWVITPLWLSGSWRSFLYSSVYSRHFLISSASVRSIPFLSFMVPTFGWNVPLVSLIFLKGSLVFRTLLFSCISFHWSMRRTFLSLLAILWNSAFRWVYQPELCLSVSCGGTGQQWPATGAGSLVQQTWAWHKPSWRRLPLTPP